MVVEKGEFNIGYMQKRCLRCTMKTNKQCPEYLLKDKFGRYKLIVRQEIGELVW